MRWELFHTGHASFHSYTLPLFWASERWTFALLQCLKGEGAGWRRASYWRIKPAAPKAMARDPACQDGIHFPSELDPKFRGSYPFTLILLYQQTMFGGNMDVKEKLRFLASPWANLSTLQHPEGWLNWSAEFPTGFETSRSFVVVERDFVLRSMGVTVTEVWMRFDKSLWKLALDLHVVGNTYNVWNFYTTESENTTSKVNSSWLWIHGCNPLARSLDVPPSSRACF